MRFQVLRPAGLVSAFVAGLIVVTVTTPDAQADVTAKADGNVTFSLSSAGGVPLLWYSQPSGWQLYAGTHLDHSDSPSPFTQEDTQFLDVGGTVSVGPASVTGYAKIGQAASQALSDGAGLSVSGVESFAHSMPPSVAFADGKAIADNLFYFDSTGIQNPPSSADFLFHAGGSVNLSGNSTQPGESWKSQYSLLFEISDFQTGQSWQYNVGDSVQGGGFASLSDVVSLDLGSSHFTSPDFPLAPLLLQTSTSAQPYYYDLRVTLDLETRAAAVPVPSPSSAVLAMLGLPLALARRRSRRRPGS